MNPQEYLSEMKTIQKSILDFLENEGDFREIIKLINDFKIFGNQHKFKSLLHLVSTIANNHYREPNFFDKIEQILVFLKPNIKQSFSNRVIFNIFWGNKKVLLILVEEKIVDFDEVIAKIISSNKQYYIYFAPEMKPFKHTSWIQKEITLSKFLETDIPDNFYELRKIGQNDKKIYELIRNDSIEEFIVYINQNNISIDSFIFRSVYMENDYIFGHDRINLIGYAALFGSIQIFKYLHKNGIKLDSYLWNYAIRGKNTEIIMTLVDENIKPRLPYEYDEYLDSPWYETEAYKEMFQEAVKCHHNDIARYLLENYLSDSEENMPTNLGLNYYNFEFIQEKFITQLSFLDLCTYDYYILVDDLLKKGGIDVNKVTIYKITFDKISN